MTNKLRRLILFAAMPGSLHAAEVANALIDLRMKSFLESKEIPGAVTLLADENRILHLSAVGLADVEIQTPIATDSIFWIASMTKPITATAVMMMQEERKLSVDDPISKYLPEFTGDKAAITIKLCLTHTSGATPISPPAGPANGSFRGLPQKANSLQCVRFSL